MYDAPGYYKREKFIIFILPHTYVDVNDQLAKVNKQMEMVNKKLTDGFKLMKEELKDVNKQLKDMKKEQPGTSKSRFHDFKRKSKKIIITLLHRSPESLKKYRPKNLMQSNKPIAQFFFLYQNLFFAISNMAKNQFLNWKKV